MATAPSIIRSATRVAGGSSSMAILIQTKDDPQIVPSKTECRRQKPAALDRLGWRLLFAHGTTLGTDRTMGPEPSRARNV